ncbi:hypothetical protein SAICODRAFT_80947 [Saitoella complicata NRRL Y-17804]|uniref:uncharacterized protein n=1 Tax=Saitoella complicata (strain BCRC 22490 / CBS 7301 / JCM 7358 / NBRC 10748 / NRRL Y-17804) TaxID=698492 RepID=UPI000867B9DF|nr:uncharacterized protein SAICODRAFT_80947 [Saitoella complicata NRRL Y-17804]ODQ52786.1 hypothetical protein SAICODRAFT_80947 [Saitoella complicata NRRL Y-17804]
MDHQYTFGTKVSSSYGGFWTSTPKELAITALNAPLRGYSATTIVRICSLLTPLLLSIIVLICIRLWTKTPFINRPDYSLLTTADDVAIAKARKWKVEAIKGARFLFGWMTTVLVSVLMVMSALGIGKRLAMGKDISEEVVETVFWAYLLLLHTHRFFPTPYRPTIFHHVSLLAPVPLVITLHRDIWPRLLVHPSEHQMKHVRNEGWFTWARLILMVAVNFLPLVTPRVWHPVDPTDKEAVPAPEQTCTPISYLGTYYWIDPVVRKGYKRDLEVDDLPPLPDYDRAKLWREKTLKNKKSSTLMTVLSLMRVDIAWMMVFTACTACCQFISPLSMNRLLAFLEDPDNAWITPYFFVVGLLIAPIAQSISMQAYVFTSTRLLVRVKSALTQELYQKTLRIRFAFSEEEAEAATTEQGKSKVGTINNLMSSDIETITNTRDFFLLVVAAPVEIIVALVFLYQLMGWSAFVGFGMLIATLPIPGLLTTRLAKMQKEVMAATDARIGLVSELLHSIRITKFFGWERAMIGRVTEKRMAEQRAIWKRTMTSIWISVVTDLLPLTNMLITFFVYTIVMKRTLTSSVAFTALSLFDILRSQFLWISFMTRMLIQAKVSFERIDKFLNDPDEIDAEQAQFLLAQAAENEVPQFVNASFAWNSSTLEKAIEKEEFQLRTLNFNFIKGGLNLVVGPTGCGKSSLLLALLGEMRLLEGSFDLPRGNGVAYVAQTAWLQNATIKENILFGSEYDEERYEKTLDACALRPDLESFEAGDQTEVGEKGVTLSGGQKQRLSLARAVYSNAQTVLLDDVLSALDIHTGKCIFENCIKGELLRGRTVILVTHHVTLCSPAADQVIVLRDGQQVQVDDAAAVLDEDLMNEIEEEAPARKDQEPDVDATPENIDTTKPAQAPASGKGGKLIQEEEKARGRISRGLIIKYMQNFGTILFAAALIAVVLNQVLVLLTTYEVSHLSDPVHIYFYLALYAAIVVGSTLMNGLTNVIFYRGSWSAAFKLHTDLVESVFGAPISWFDSVPIGRVINRFSKDVRALDSVIVQWLRMTADNVVRVVVRIASIAAIMPIFAIPAAAVTVIGYFIGEMYIKAQVAVKRIVSITESPLFSHFGDTILGAITIRAFGAQERFSQENMRRIDAHTRPLETLYNVNRWVCVRADAVGSLVAFTAGFLALANGKVSPGLVGFSLVNAVGFSETVLFLVRCSNELEVEMNSYERVKEYIGIKQEPKSTQKGTPPASWPSEGDVVVKDLTVRYNLDGPDILKKVSFVVNPREKVGIVGRTGSGKSTLGLSLLRFTEKIGGIIQINGVDIDKLNLDALRQRVSIIPQDPVLFSGTIRSNLDPFGEASDAELNLALRASGMLDFEDESYAPSGSATPTGTMKSTKSMKQKLNLDSAVTENGNNFSQGQRQILALARAIVRRSKLIILDEATASVDFATDAKIQLALRTEFKESTILTVAHRLRTIMDYDKVLVLEAGEVAEFDTPANLLKKQGIFYTMVKRSGEYTELAKIAEGNGKGDEGGQ